MREAGVTSFSCIYDSFLARITDDMYMELTELETFEMLQDMLINAIPRFQFPRFNLQDYELGGIDYIGTYCGVETDYDEVEAFGWVGGFFNSKLTQEEVNIFAVAMEVEWLTQQLETTKLTEMRYPGQDFKVSSQANHMSKLKVLIDVKKQDLFHLQRLYKRREITEDGAVRSTMSKIITKPNQGIQSTEVNRIGSYQPRGRYV